MDPHKCLLLLRRDSLSRYTLPVKPPISPIAQIAIAHAAIAAFDYAQGKLQPHRKGYSKRQRWVEVLDTFMAIERRTD